MGETAGGLEGHRKGRNTEVGRGGLRWMTLTQTRSGALAAGAHRLGAVCEKHTSVRAQEVL